MRPVGGGRPSSSAMRRPRAPISAPYRPDERVQRLKTRVTLDQNDDVLVRSTTRRRALAWTVLLIAVIGATVAVGFLATWPTAGAVGALLLAIYAAIPAIRADMRAAVSGDSQPPAAPQQVSRAAPASLDGGLADAAAAHSPAHPDGEHRAATTSAYTARAAKRGPWDARLNAVEAALAHWITGPTSIRNIAERAGLALSRIPQEGTPINIWHAVLSRSVVENKVDTVMTLALEEEPSDDLRRAINGWRDSRDG